MAKRFAWTLLGLAAGSVPGLIYWAVTGQFKIWPAFLVAQSGSALLLWYLERQHKIKSIEELHRPLTIFPHERV